LHGLRRLPSLLLAGRLWARLLFAWFEQRDIEAEEVGLRLVETLHQILVHPVFEMEQLGAHRRQVELEDRRIVERGARLEIERGATKAVYHTASDQKGIAEDEGLPAARVFTEAAGVEIAGMPADNRIFEGSVLRSVGGGRPHALRRQTGRRVAVPAGQRADDADESVSVAEIEKRGFQLGKRFDEAFEPIARRTPLRGRKWPLQRRIGIDVAGPHIDVAYREATQPGFDAGRQPVAILIVKHFVRLRPADPGCHGGPIQHRLRPAAKHPEHARIPLMRYRARTS
jgi:hypothetical protein